MNNLNYKTQERLLAIQLLYSYDLNQNNSLKAKSLNSNLNQNEQQTLDHEYADKLFKGVKDERNIISQTLNNNLTGAWNLNKLDIILKIIFEVAIYELSFVGDIPAKIILDDYVSLTKSFYEKDKEIGFANAILHQIAVSLRADEMVKKLEVESIPSSEHIE